MAHGVLSTVHVSRRRRWRGWKAGPVREGGPSGVLSLCLPFHDCTQAPQDLRLFSCRSAPCHPPHPSPPPPSPTRILPSFSLPPRAPPRRVFYLRIYSWCNCNEEGVPLRATRLAVVAVRYTDKGHHRHHGSRWHNHTLRATRSCGVSSMFSMLGSGRHTAPARGTRCAGMID